VNQSKKKFSLLLVARVIEIEYFLRFSVVWFDNRQTMKGRMIQRIDHISLRCDLKSAVFLEDWGRELLRSVPEQNSVDDCGTEPLR
jgi:hypothetical protein